MSSLDGSFDAGSVYFTSRVELYKFSDYAISNKYTPEQAETSKPDAGNAGVRWRGLSRLRVNPSTLVSIIAKVEYSIRFGSCVKTL